LEGKPGDLIFNLLVLRLIVNKAKENGGVEAQKKKEK